MIKKLIIGATVLMLSFPMNAFAAEPVKVVLNGNTLSFDVDPVVKEGRTLVPLRVIFESLGLSVDWQEETMTVIGKKEDTEIRLPVNQSVAYMNGIQMPLDVPAQIVNSRTVVPVRFISESLGCDVDWDGDTQTVSINKGVNASDWIVDENLEAAIRNKVKKPAGIITKRDLESIKSLNASSYGIESFEGIQYLINLENLDVSNNKMKDLKAISDLKALKVLTVLRSELESLEGIEHLSNLENLNAACNEIKDITPLSTLTNLTVLELTKNKIEDITPISQLTVLKGLGLGINQISDIQILANLTNLEYVFLTDNKIVNIEPLKKLTNLTYLSLGENQIVDITVLEDLPQLTQLEIHYNQIVDLSSLFKLTNLEYLNISGNPADESEIIKAFDNVEY